MNQLREIIVVTGGAALNLFVMKCQTNGGVAQV